MILKNREAAQIISSLDKCKNSHGFCGMAIGIAKRKITSEIEEYLVERQRIFQEFGVRNGDGWMIPSDSPNFNEAFSRLSEIDEYSFEVSINQFSEEEFMEKFQSDSLTAENYEILYEIFVKKEGEINGDKQ